MGTFTHPISVRRKSLDGHRWEIRTRHRADLPSDLFQRPPYHLGGTGGIISPAGQLAFRVSRGFHESPQIFVQYEYRRRRIVWGREKCTRSSSRRLRSISDSNLTLEEKPV